MSAHVDPSEDSMEDSLSSHQIEFCYFLSPSENLLPAGWVIIVMFWLQVFGTETVHSSVGLQ